MKIIPFLLPILFLTNCTTNKQAFSSWGKTDSLQQTTHLSIQTTQIPESHACLTIPGTALKELPAGAAFIQKSGQATAKVQFGHVVCHRHMRQSLESCLSIRRRSEKNIRRIFKNNSGYKKTYLLAFPLSSPDYIHNRSDFS